MNTEKSSDLPPACIFGNTSMINCESTWPYNNNAKIASQCKIKNLGSILTS